jgi:exopolysaccharide/PEP-CTERM locus tyrosine autokinase
MSRIEDAIERLRSSTTAASVRRPQAARQIGSVVQAPPGGHVYGGKAIKVDTAALTENGLLAPDTEVRALSEQYRTIKRPLLKNASPQAVPPVPLGNLIMVMSALSGEGKTFSCVNLCFSIARESDWSVLLIDGDVVKPHLTRLFGAQQEPGLLDLIKNPSLEIDAVVMPTDIPGFSLMPAGRPDPQAPELLASDRMRELCAALASDPQRMTVFDSPPMLLTSEAPILASHVGQLLVIVKANSTSRQAVQNAVEKLDHTKPIGCVLNQQVKEIETADGAYYGYNYGE